MRDGINVVLISPRRYGKTSLHRAARACLAASRPPAAVVEANLLHAGSRSRFAALLAGAAFQIRGARWARARQTVPEFVRRLRVTPTVSFDQAGNPRFGGRSVRKTLLPLLDNDDVVQRDGAMIVADPFFAAWLRGAG